MKTSPGHITNSYMNSFIKRELLVIKPDDFITSQYSLIEPKERVFLLHNNTYCTLNIL